MSSNEDWVHRYDLSEDVKNQETPAGLAKDDGQGDSETCVRFAISKAVVMDLFIAKQIDIEQNHISICLVQALRGYTPTNVIKPDMFNGVELYLHLKYLISLSGLEL